jgi:hypothetical protein
VYDPDENLYSLDVDEMDEVEQLRDLVHTLLYKNTKLSHTLAKKRQQVMILERKLKELKCKTRAG